MCRAAQAPSEITQTGIKLSLFPSSSCPHFDRPMGESRLRDGLSASSRCSCATSTARLTYCRMKRPINAASFYALDTLPCPLLLYNSQPEVGKGKNGSSQCCFRRLCPPLAPPHVQSQILPPNVRRIWLWRERVRMDCCGGPPQKMAIVVAFGNHGLHWRLRIDPEFPKRLRVCQRIWGDRGTPGHHA